MPLSESIRQSGGNDRQSKSGSWFSGQAGPLCLSVALFVTLVYMYEIRAENIAVVSGTNLIWTFSGFVLINGDRYGAF